MKSSARRSLPRLLRRPRLHPDEEKPRAGLAPHRRATADIVGALEQALPASPPRVPDAWREAFERKVQQALVEQVQECWNAWQEAGASDPSLLRQLQESAQELARWRSKPAPHGSGR